MKKKIVIVSLIVCILVLSIASTTMAYFTDTDKATNVFTAGEVKIELSEAVTKVADNKFDLVADGDNRVTTATDAITTNYGKIYPAQKITKDPTIKNVGTEEAYIGAVITITNVDADANDTIVTGNVKNILVIPETTVGTDSKAVEITTFLTNFIEEGVTVTYEEITGGYRVYVVYTEGVTAGTTLDPLFEGISVPANWDNKEMKDCVELNIIVDAYAVQTAGFTSADAALKAAFPEVFQ